VNNSAKNAPISEGIDLFIQDGQDHPQPWAQGDVRVVCNGILPNIVRVGHGTSLR